MTFSAFTDADFEARWAIWQRHGIAHERAVRRKLLLLLPALAVVVAAAAYLLRFN